MIAFGGWLAPLVVTIRHRHMSNLRSSPELPDAWPFDQAPSCSAFTTIHVLRGGQPITQVYHDADDHGWQFHYSGPKSAADAMVVALREIYYYDPTVVEVADLPPGWRAIRAGLGQPWKREANR